MKTTSMRRLGAAFIAPAVVAGAIATAPSAQAANNASETAVVAWLADQPKVDGLFVSYFGPTRADSFVDYGLNLDLYVALDSLGNANADKIYDASVAGADEYTDGGGQRYAGAIGKLTAMVQRHGGDATAVGGRDLVAQTEALVSTDGAETGRAVDLDLTPEEPPESEFFFETSNTIGQGWVVRALSNASSPRAADTVTYLLKQQCDDGSFRIQMADEQCTDGDASVDATAFAIQALGVAGGHQTEVDDAVDYLVGAQNDDGSFDDQGSSNTNSTGLAAVALAAHGDIASDDPAEQAAGQAAAEAAGWVDGRRVTSGDEEGAIALDDTDFAAASSAPVARVDRDRYVRATVQAALSLKSLAAAVQLQVTAPTGFVSGGKTIQVSATGLDPSEAFSVSVSGVTAFRGTASAGGVATASVAVPASTSTRTVKVTGSRAARAGSTTVKVLGAKTLAPTVKYASVKRGKTQTVSVTGLAAGEPVKVYVSSKLVKTATATATGTYAYNFAVGTATGKKTVKVNGAFTNRTGSKTYTVS